jgi:uncharacterized protein (TIGR02996 family)
MSNEAAFLEAIRAAPIDRTTRLIYADWLDDRGDPRCELIRIEEEMRQLPVFSDRYWQLKPRRNELRARAMPDWLQEMRYGTDYQPIFRHGVPEGWKERWRLIREFMDRWCQQTLPDVGGRVEEIRAAEIRLGRTLPPSVREWIAFAHDVRRADNYHDVLRDVYQMRELDGLSAVSLLLQAEGDYHWAVRHTDLALPDPPVHGFHWDFENNDEDTFVPDEANPIARTLTSFALGYVLAYTRGEGGGFGTDVHESAELVRALENTFAVRSKFEETEFFEAENILVRLNPCHWESGKRLNVEVFKPMPREALPAFLWDYTRNGGSFHGMFIREDLRARADEAPPQRAQEGEEIPF